MKDKKKLIGDQNKLDANKDGEITASDFAALRERTQKQMGGMMKPRNRKKTLTCPLS